MQINKKEFESYEKIRSEGYVNMFDIRRVKIDSGLNNEQVLHIMENYTELADKYGRMENQDPLR